LDNPRTYSPGDHSADAHEPLPILTPNFDFLRPHMSSGPEAIFSQSKIQGWVKEGDRLFGSAIVVCPECIRGHTFLVYIVFGHGGWYWELKTENNGNLIVPSKLSIPNVEA
jgi:hypothetical protein